MPISTESLRVLAHQHPIVLLGTSLVITIVTCIFVTKQRKLKTGHSSYLLHSKEHGISTDKTQLLRCNISHHRLFPKSHGFVYSYLSVGVPVRSPSSNWLLSINTRNWCSRGLLQVAAKDHFNRGRDGETLAENLDAYLKQQVLERIHFVETGKGLTTNTGSTPGRLSSRIPAHFTSLSQLQVQPRVLLVSLHGRLGVSVCYCGSE
jgi:hypothetical protein